MDKNKENFNYLCYDFSNKITQIINESGLPLFAIYFILRDFFDQIATLKEEEIQSFIEEKEPKTVERIIEVPKKPIEEEEEE